MQNLYQCIQASRTIKVYHREETELKQAYNHQTVLSLLYELLIFEIKLKINFELVFYVPEVLQSKATLFLIVFLQFIGYSVNLESSAVGNYNNGSR